MGEFEFLERIYTANVDLPASVTIPPGDDMGAIEIDGRTTLVAVDQLAEGVHFAPDSMDDANARRIGRKAVARCLSDVAAMAAWPAACVATAMLRRGTSEAVAMALVEGMRAVANEFDCPVIGGDVGAWDQPSLLTVTVMARPHGIEPVLRSGAQIGDSIFVTGELGGSLIESDGYAHHFDFTPRIREARKLGADPNIRPHCMIDISDGLASDLRHLCEASNVSAEIESNALPIRESVPGGAVDRWRRALSDGEDYELLFTAPIDSAPRRIGDVPVTLIGTVRQMDKKPQVIAHKMDGTREDVTGIGWEHDIT